MSGMSRPLYRLLRGALQSPDVRILSALPHSKRPHQSMGNRLLSGEVPEDRAVGEIYYQQRLSGLLKSYQRRRDS
jgi:hypothetical protein